MAADPDSDHLARPAQADVRLGLGLSDHDHTGSLVTGAVQVAGAEVVADLLGIEELFARAGAGEHDVSEFALGAYCARRSRGDDTLTGLPVFPSRAFRQSAFLVPADSPLREPEQLRGRRVVVPEWAQTAGIWARAWLADDVGVPLAQVDWVQAGAASPGLVEDATSGLPDGVRLRRVDDRSALDLLRDGEADALLSARAPAGSGLVPLLRERTWQVEREHAARTGLFPVMHLVVVRTALLREHPALAQGLDDAFTAARDAALDRVVDRASSRLPLPWVADLHDQARALLGGEPFAYGVEAARPVLEAFLGACDAQRVTSRRLGVDELFALPGD